MPNKKSSSGLSKKQTENIVRGIIYAVLIIAGLLMAYIYWMGAGLSLCGISGCSGGGFGVSYSPESVKRALVLSGIFAAIAPFIIFFISKFKWWWIVIAVATLIIIPLLGAMLIGAGLDGYPLNRIK